MTGERERERALLETEGITKPTAGEDDDDGDGGGAKDAGDCYRNTSTS